MCRWALKIAGLMLSWICAGSGVLCAQEPAGAAPASLPTITTDRPAITDASTVVAKGALVLENGFTETASQGERSFDFPETLLRLGASAKTELRFTVPDYFSNFNAGAGFASGWGDLGLGVKQQLFAGPSFDAALIAGLSFPTGTHALSSHGYDPQVLAPWSHPLTKNLTAAGMFSLFWLTQSSSSQGNERNLTGQVSFLLDEQINSRWDAFTEYAGEFPQRGGPQHLLHVGTSYKITPNQQVDFHLGYGLSAAAVDHFVGVGYSFQVRARR